MPPPRIGDRRSSTNSPQITAPPAPARRGALSFPSSAGLGGLSRRRGAVVRGRGSHCVVQQGAGTGPGDSGGASCGGLQGGSGGLTSGAVPSSGSWSQENQPFMVNQDPSASPFSPPSKKI